MTQKLRQPQFVILHKMLLVILNYFKLFDMKSPKLKPTKTYGNSPVQIMYLDICLITQSSCHARYGKVFFHYLGFFLNYNQVKI